MLTRYVLGLSLFLSTTWHLPVASDSRGCVAEAGGSWWKANSIGGCSCGTGTRTVRSFHLTRANGSADSTIRFKDKKKSFSTFVDTTYEYKSCIQYRYGINQYKRLKPGFVQNCIPYPTRGQSCCISTVWRTISKPSPG